MDDRLFSFARSWHFYVVLILAIFTPVRGGQDALYPYGPGASDHSVGNIGQQKTEVQMPIPVKFYGQTSQTVYISKDGMIGLNPSVYYLELKWRDGTPNSALDLPFIAPFHYDGFFATLSPELYHGKIYYKLLSRARNNIDLSEEDRAFMDQLDRYVMNASVAVKTDFVSQFVLKVTWENVTSREACDNIKLQTPEGCPSNTFQVVLVGNTDFTFAIFNYYKMEIPYTKHQVAGVNGGHGRGWTYVIPCTGPCKKRTKFDSKRIMSLITRAGSDVEGRYILVVSGDNIIRGGCLSPELKSEEAEMEVFPRQAGMFGGEMLAVSGRCYDPGTRIYCRFGQNNQAISQGVMETQMRGRCPVPILTTRGEVAMEISVDNVNWMYMTTITIILPSRLPSPIDLSNIISNWQKTNPDALEVNWGSELFSTNRAAMLDIKLIGYKEDVHSITNPMEMRTLVQLATGVMNADGHHRIDPSQFSCTSECEDFEIGLVQLRLSDQYVDETTKYQAVTFGPVPLGWYVNNAMKQRYGSDWPVAKCKAWDSQDKANDDWLDHLLPCPCTLSQALADWGRWQPDLGCNMFSGSVCSYHIGAKHCVRSVHPSRDNSGNQCCYGDDGNLHYAADSYQGSTPDRSHDWGAAPFGKPNMVPSLSHWIHDVVTFYYCCLWVEYRECNYYMNRRATRDCKAYRPPHSATVFGDPHITTFDNTSYHFKGLNDFWLLQSDRGLNIQGRFEEREDEFLQIQNKQLRPTNLTSVVMWVRLSDVITVRLAPNEPPYRKLDILVNGQRQFFEDTSQYWQDFKGVSIVNNKRVSDGNDEDALHSNFTIFFYGHGGAAVQVAERQGLLHLVVNLPPNKDIALEGSEKTSGLFGTLDGNAANDFTTPQGAVIPADSNEDIVYLDFTQKWNVLINESKFHWPKNVTDDNSPLFGNPQDFIYKNSNLRPTENMVTSVCGNSQPCIFDYYVTNDETVARATKKAEAAFQTLRRSHTTVLSCGLLDIPMAIKTPAIYTEGSEVTVTGCRPNNGAVQGSGPTTYVCANVSGSSSGPQWSPQPVQNLCPYDLASLNSPEKASDTGMIIGIVVGVVVVVALVVLLLVFLVRRRHSKSGEDSETARPTPAKRSKAVPTDVVVEPGTDETLIKHREAERDRVRMSEVRRAGSEEAV